MSKIAISPGATGNAVFTIQAPSTETSRTLVLPDNAGTVLTSASDLAAANLTGNVAAARITDALNASGSAPIYACRAWVNFDGTTSPGTIRASGNVSSVTRSGTASYTVNFTTAMPDANYGANVSAAGVVGVTNAIFTSTDMDAGSRVNPTTSSLALTVYGFNGAAISSEFVRVSIFR
jgi:hypothetical protein